MTAADKLTTSQKATMEKLNPYGIKNKPDTYMFYTRDAENWMDGVAIALELAEPLLAALKPALEYWKSTQICVNNCDPHVNYHVAECCIERDIEKAIKQFRGDE